jgi:FtsZ-interacting cell division protein YlmF
MPPSSH